jgi:hypothetical protein
MTRILCLEHSPKYLRNVWNSPTGPAILAVLIIDDCRRNS